MSCKLFLLLCLTIFVTSQSQGNIWVNTYFQNVNTSLVPFLHIITRGRFGQTMISLINPKGNFTGIAYLSPPKTRRWLQLSGNFTDLLIKPLREINATVIWKDNFKEKVVGRIFDEIEIILELPLHLASNESIIFVGMYRYLTLGYHPSTKPEIGKVIDKPVQILQTTFRNDTFLTPQIPLIYTRAEFYHYGLLIALNLVYLLTFIFALIFRNVNPLQSKGFIPFLSL